MLRVLSISALFMAIALLQGSNAETADDIFDEIKSMRPFELKKSAMACPVILVGNACPEDTPLYYFKCCGELNSNCCFRLQEWVMCLLIILAVLIVISIVVNFIRCLCCY